VAQQQAQRLVGQAGRGAPAARTRRRAKGNRCAARRCGGLAPECREVGALHLCLACELRQQLAPQRTVGQGLPKRPGLREHARTALGTAEVGPGAGVLDQLARQRHGLGDLLVERGRSELAHEAVRIVFGRQEQKTHGAQVGGVGQRGFERAAGSAAACGVAVEAEDHRVGEAEQLLHMLGGAGRAERGHGIAEAALRQRDHVHVAFDHQHVALGAQRASNRP
jgi:hypothetical protein